MDRNRSPRIQRLCRKTADLAGLSFATKPACARSKGSLSVATGFRGGRQHSITAIDDCDSCGETPFTSQHAKLFQAGSTATGFGRIIGTGRYRPGHGNHVLDDRGCAPYRSQQRDRVRTHRAISRLVVEVQHRPSPPSETPAWSERTRWLVNSSKLRP